ncbi:MAG TPA: HTTM domain-containing protein [Polyangiaceae bacterium]|nr:HTTM domain-containing protein [Polyangiaceae bacterium]
MSEPGLRERFSAFWLSPSRGSAVSLFRIAYAATAVWMAINVLRNVERYYGDTGLVPWAVVQDQELQRFSLFSLAPHSQLLPWLLGVGFLLAALGLLIGVGSRWCALGIFVINVSLQHRNPFIYNAGDRLFVILALLAAFLPLGARWSLEAWRRVRRGLRAPVKPIWFQRLVALQVAYVYLNAYTGKAGQASWRNGSAVAEILSSEALSTTPITGLSLLGPLLTWSTLIFELCFPVLVWSRSLRPYLLVAGILFHIGIQLTMAIPGFGLVMVASYACFLSDDEAERLVAALFSPRRQLTRARTWLAGLARPG